MTLILESSIVAANEAYAAKFTPEDVNLQLPPVKEVAVVTCMDTNIMPASALGFKLGDAHLIRNGGGSAREALRSLVVSQQLFGTKAILIIKHTDCAMTKFDNPTIHSLIKKNLGVNADDQDFGSIEDIEQAVRDEVEFLKTHELIPEVVRGNTTGWIYDAMTGKLTKVV
ncbi:beta carbonic anhydrase clade D [Morchella conica CCBAS932]|uniref:Carbonic anhydrase n=1 Tax=Morchella conica CCBAS932 TaxID=1392247 RepID=A0A3N4KVM0_9PEZI|nr:beta carbonic anhydrase clade D [Morchella conica CCBAS932]